MHRDHFVPHRFSGFEGYYTRTQLEDGSTIIIIFCWVRHAKVRNNLVLVSFTPVASQNGITRPPQPRSGTQRRKRAAALPAFKYDFFPERMDVLLENSSKHGQKSFTISALGIGSMNVTPTTIEYAISVPEKGLRVHLVLDTHTPWATAHPLRGPMGAILHLSRVLPLNWHVRSTKSRATHVIEHAGASACGTGLAHAEKNWGRSFPRGWIWAQAFSTDGERTLCLAGGAALPGVQAYLGGYRSPEHSWDFRPPFAMGLGRLSPCMRVRQDSQAGEVYFRVVTWFKRVEIRMEAPPESFIEMPAPLKSGHEPGFAHESFQTKVVVKLSRRKWPLAKWNVVEESVLGQTADGSTNCGALEFGGSFWHAHST